MPASFCGVRPVPGAEQGPGRCGCLDGGRFGGQVQFDGVQRDEGVQEGGLAVRVNPEDVAFRLCRGGVREVVGGDQHQRDVEVPFADFADGLRRSPSRMVSSSSLRWLASNRPLLVRSASRTGCRVLAIRTAPRNPA